MNEDSKMRAFLSFGPRATVALLLLASGLASGCGGGSKAATLELVSPTNNASITLADDVDPATPGVQIDVLVNSTRLTVDDGDITVYVEPSLDRSLFRPEDFTAAGSATLAEDGTATIRVTLADGDYDVMACARELCGVRSEVARISVSTGCATISFTAPAAPTGGRTILGPEDDEDGTACGETFQTTVSVSTDAGDGATVALNVNGIAAGTTNVSGTVATFPAIVLGNRGDTPNTLSVTVTRADGVSCDQDFPGQVMVDCMGVSCTLTQPDTARAFLNASDDASPGVDGFQADFEVQSDPDALGQPILLVLDDDESGALSADPVAGAGGATASYGPIDLTEGVHRAQAICSDSAGNVTRSSVGEWTIDTTPCGVAVSEPAADSLFVDADDVDASTDGIQVNVTGTSTGSDCSVARVGICDSTLADASLSGGSFSGVSTLASSPMQEICAEVEDAAGNVAEARVSVRVRTDAPQLEIVTPTAPAAFNSAGDATHGADMDTATPACEVAFTVNCTDVDSPVDLVREDTMTVLGTANCDVVGGLPAPFMGQATFASVALPSVSAAAGNYNVVARETADRLTGTSTPLSVVPDCEVPTFSVSQPSSCLTTDSATLRPAIDDVDASAPGFQYTVNVLNNNGSPVPDVDLRVDGSVIATSTTRTALSNIFTNVTFTTGGTLVLDACGTDANGNTGCASACSVTIVDLPTVNIASPAVDATLDASADCDGTVAGFQVRVQGTTDAAAGAGTTATVTINGGTPVDISSDLTTSGSGASFNACVDAPQGAALPIVVEVTDSRGTASDSVTVTIDSMPPTAAISDLAAGAATDRRGGMVPFTWTAVADAGAGGALTSYEMRCAKTAIATEADWMAATSFPITTAPGSPTSVEMETVGGFRVGETMHCTMRGSDITGAMTPLGNDAAVTLDFLEQSVMGTGGANLGGRFASVGDVSGDTIDDFIVGGAGKAYLFLGSAGAVPTTPAVTFTGFDNGTVATWAAGLGDFNGDSINDIAISSGLENGFKGAVYIIFGHSAASPWPATVDMASGGCGADICLRGTDTFELLSSPPGIAAAGDFDGDGLTDLLVGAQGTGLTGATGPGAAYLVRGSTTLSGNVNLPGSGAGPDGFKIMAPVGSGTFFGTALTSMGDIDGDGRADLVIGDSGNTGADDHIYLITGRAHTGAGLMDVTATLLDQGPNPFGIRIMNIGDYDGNGQVDLAIQENAASVGRVRIYPGSGGGYSAATSFVINNDTANRGSDLFGRSLGQSGHPVFGPEGDLDGDGRTDVLTGSKQLTTGVGSVELFYGQASGARNRSEADHSFQPTASTGSAERICGYIGDVDGDGFADFAIGDPTGQSGAGEFWIEH